MRDTFVRCDRCTAPAKGSSPQLQLLIETSGDFQSTNLLPADLCNRCYGDLIHWFGDYNTRTGLAFEKHNNE